MMNACHVASLIFMLDGYVCRIAVASAGVSLALVGIAASRVSGSAAWIVTAALGISAAWIVTAA